MRKFIPVLNSKGLLAASIAMLSGPALAEVAGRVTFVSGNATAKAADGATRTLKRGDIINGGDRISTNAGRLQLRFTDGGFVALQPGTVFGVDEYVYANRKPEDTSVFFSLIQGGMRTITGAIGKINKKSYQVRTPVATIGIRGTEYRARLTENGLIVSVGAGYVNVSNTEGDVTGGAGQNIVVRGLGAGPQLGQEEAMIPAAGVDGDPVPLLALPELDLNRTISLADVLEADGNYTFLFTQQGRVSLPDSNLALGGPLYLLSTPNSAIRDTGTQYFATFDQTGAATGTVGGLTGLSSSSGSVLSTSFASGSLQVVNSGTLAALSWGEFTNGTPTPDQNWVFDICSGDCPNFTLPNAPFAVSHIPYVVGIAPSARLGKGTATYSLQGATPVRDQHGAVGTLNSFNLKVNLDFSTVAADFSVTMPGVITAALQNLPAVTYKVGTTAPVSLYNLGSSPTFSLDSTVLTVTDSNNACSSITCYAGFDGFFAGDAGSQIGVNFFIDDLASTRTMDGVAALGLSTYNSATVLPSGDGYTLAYAMPSAYGVRGGYTASDPATLASLDRSLTVSFDGNGLLVSATQSDVVAGTLTIMDRGTATAVDGGQAGALKWGRWYNGGSIDIGVTAGGTPTSLAPGKSLAYVVGPMTQPGAFDAITTGYGWGAKATYTFQGGTKAAGSDGINGTMRAGSTLGVTFFGSSPQLDMDLNVDMSNGTNYHLTGTTNALVGDTGASFGFSSFSSCVSSAPAANGCFVSAEGFFAGPQAQQIGLSYHISDSTRTVDGAAAFGRGSITPGSTAAP